MSSSGKKKVTSSPRWHVSSAFGTKKATTTPAAAAAAAAASSSSSTPAGSPSSDKTQPRLPDSSPSRSPSSRSPRNSLSGPTGSTATPTLVQPLWVAPTHKQVIVPLKSPWQKAQEASLALDHAINAHSLSQAEQQYQQLLSLLTASVAASNSSVPQPQHQLNPSHTNFVIDALSRHLFLFPSKVQESALDQLRSLLSPSALILPEAEALAVRINVAKNLTQIVQVHMQPAAAVKSIVDSLVNLLWIDFDATEYEQHQLLWSACFDRSLVPVFVQLFRLTYESAAKLTQSANDVDARAHVALLDHLLACLSEQSSAIDSHHANDQICEQLKALLIEDDMVPLTHKHFLSFFANLIRLHDFDSANDLPLLGGNSEVSEEQAEMKREREAQFIEDMNLILARRSGIERDFQPQLNENVQLFISCIALADAYESHGVEVKPFADYYERSIAPRLNEVDPLYRKELIKAARTVSTSQEDRSATPSRSNSRPPSTPTVNAGNDAPMGPRAVMQLMETLQATKGGATNTNNENAIGSQPLPPLPISASELTSAPRRPPSPTRASTPTLGSDSAQPLPFVPAVANKNGKQLNGFVPINPARDGLASSPVPARSPSHSPLPSRSPSASPNAATQNDKLVSDLRKENEALKSSLQTAQSSYTALLKSSEAESNEVASLRVAKTQLQKQLSEERARFAALEPLTPGNRDRESIGTAHRELAEAELELRLKDAHLIRLEGELREAMAKAGSGDSSSSNTTDQASAATIQDLKQQLEELEEEVIELRAVGEEQDKKSADDQAAALAAQFKKLTESHQKEMEQVLQQWKRDVMTKDEALAAAGVSGDAGNSDERIKALQAQVATLLQQLATSEAAANEARTTLETERLNFQQQLYNATAAVTAASADSESNLQVAQEKLQKLESLEQELQIDLLAVRNENALLQEQAKHFESQIKELNTRVEAQQHQANEQTSNDSATNAELNALKARVAELEQTIQEGEGQVEELNNEIATLTQQAKDSEADLESIETENADLKQSLADAQDALSEAQTAIQQANTALEESESELQRAKDELADADAQHEAQVEQVKAEAAEVHTNLSQESEARYNDQLLALQEEIDDLKSASTKSSSHSTTTLPAEIQDLHQQLMSTQRSLADSEAKLKAQSEELNVRVQEVEFDSQKELRASAQQLTQTQRALAHAEQQAKDLKDELALMKETNASAANAPDLPLPTSANYAQIVSLKQQVAQLTESLSKSSGVNIEPIVKDANESRVKVAKLEEDVQSLSLQLEEAHALLAEAQTVISTLKNDAKVADAAAATALSELQERLEKQEDINVELHDRLEAAEAHHATRAAPAAEEVAQSAAGPDKDEEAQLEAYERSHAVPAVQSIAPSGSLQQQLKDAKEYIKELEGATTIAVTELENEKLQLQDQLAERDARIAELSAKQGSASIPISTDARLAQLEAELKAVKAEASASNLAASTRVGELKLESKSLQETLSTAKLRIADLEGVADVELENFKNILHKQQRDLDATLQSRAAEYEARIKELEAAEAASQEKLNEMQGRLDAAHVSLDLSRVENNLLTRRGIDYESLSNQLSSFEIQVASLRDDLATKEEDLAHALTDLKQHQTHLEEAQQGEQNATTALLTVQSELTSLRSEHDELLPLKSELERLNKTYEEFRASQADSLRSLLAHAEAKAAHELKAIKEENDTKLLLSATQAEMQLTACEAQLRTEKAQSEQWRTQYQVLAETHQQLVVNAEQHQQTMLQMRSAYVHVLNELRGQLRSLRESSNRCRSDVLSMRATVQADVARAAPSTTHYITAGLQALHDRYRANIDSLESKRQTESSRLIVQANNANMELLVHKKMVSQLQEDLTATQAKADKSDQEIARLKEELITSASAALTSASGAISSRNTGDLTVLLSRSEANVKHLTTELQQRHEEILELQAQLQHSGLANYGEESVNNSLQSIQEEERTPESKAKTLHDGEEAVAKSAGADDTSATIAFDDEDSSSTHMPVDAEPTIQPALTVNVNSSSSTTTGSPIETAAVAPASVSTVSPPSSAINKSVVASSETERSLRQRLLEVEQNLNAALFNHQIALADASKNLEQLRHESADTIAAMELKLQERERELAAQNAAVALRQTQIDSLQSQLSSMEALHASLKNQLNAEQRTAELNLANSQTASEEKLKMLLLEHEQHLSRLADEALGDRASGEAALKASMERYAALQESLENERQEAGSTRAQLLHRINDLQDALTHAEAECVSLRAHVAAAAEAVASESSLSHERLAEAQHHAAELTESRAIFNLLQKQYEALMEEHERVTSAEKIRVAIQKKDSDSLEKERLAERMELETFKRSYRDLEIEKKDLIVRNQSLYDELVAAKARLVEAEHHTTTISQLNESLESSKVEAARLSAELEHTLIQRAQLQQERSHGQMSHSQLEQTHTSLRDQFAQVSRQLLSAKAEVESLSKQLNLSQTQREEERIAVDAQRRAQDQLVLNLQSEVSSLNRIVLAETNLRAVAQREVAEARIKVAETASETRRKVEEKEKESKRKTELYEKELERVKSQAMMDKEKMLAESEAKSKTAAAAATVAAMAAATKYEKSFANTSAAASALKINTNTSPTHTRNLSTRSVSISTPQHHPAPSLEESQAGKGAANDSIVATPAPSPASVANGWSPAPTNFAPSQAQAAHGSNSLYGSPLSTVASPSSNSSFLSSPGPASRFSNFLPQRHSPSSAAFPSASSDGSLLTEWVPPKVPQYEKGSSALSIAASYKHMTSLLAPSAGLGSSSVASASRSVITSSGLASSASILSRPFPALNAPPAASPTFSASSAASRNSQLSLDFTPVSTHAQPSAIATSATPTAAANTPSGNSTARIVYAPSGVTVTNAIQRPLSSAPALNASAAAAAPSEPFRSTLPPATHDRSSGTLESAVISELDAHYQYTS